MFERWHPRLDIPLDEPTALRRLSSNSPSQEIRGLCEKVHPDCLAMSRRRLEAMEFKATGMMLRHPDPTDQRLCCQGAHFDLPFVGLATAIATSHLGKAAPCPASHHTCQGICGKPPSDGQYKRSGPQCAPLRCLNQGQRLPGFLGWYTLSPDFDRQKAPVLRVVNSGGKPSPFGPANKFYIPCEDYGRQWADDF